MHPAKQLRPRRATHRHASRCRLASRSRKSRKNYGLSIEQAEAAIRAEVRFLEPDDIAA